MFLSQKQQTSFLQFWLLIEEILVEHVVLMKCSAKFLLGVNQHQTGKQCCKLHYCLWRVSIKSYFLIHSVFFVSEGNLFDIYFTKLQLVLVPCGGSRTSPRTSPVLPRTSPQCRLYFISFGIIWFIVVYLKNGVLLILYARGHKQCCKLHYCLWRVSIVLRIPCSNS